MVYPNAHIFYANTQERHPPHSCSVCTQIEKDPYANASDQSPGGAAGSSADNSTHTIVTPTLLTPAFSPLFRDSTTGEDGYLTAESRSTIAASYAPPMQGGGNKGSFLSSVNESVPANNYIDFN